MSVLCPKQWVSDAFEGRMWKNAQTNDAVPFLSRPHNYRFMLNMDRMQPFSHNIYWVGLMYLVLMNLPRSGRFKRQSVFLIGIIPSTSEPSLNINAFLFPLVDDILIIWKEGVVLKHSGSLISELLYYAWHAIFRLAERCVGLRNLIRNMDVINAGRN